MRLCGGWRTRRQGQTNVTKNEAKGRAEWLNQFPKIKNEVSAALMLRGLSGAEWEVLWDVWQNTSGHYDRSKRAARTEYTATAEQIAERCSHSADHVRKAISRLVKQNILHRPVVGRHGAPSVLAFNWDNTTWIPRDEVSAGKTHSRSETTAYEDDISRSKTTAYGDTAGQKRPPKDAIAGQKRPPFFNGNLRAEPKALPLVNCSNVETAPESADRETAAPAAFDGCSAAESEPDPPVDRMTDEEMEAWWRDIFRRVRG